MVVFYSEMIVNMQINKLVLVLVLVSISPITLADSGVINFIGQVIEGESCTTTINDETGDKTINLPTVLTSDFLNAGDAPSKGMSIPFKFTVSGCDASVYSRGVHFSLSSNNFDSSNNNLLKNNALDGATNIGIEILEGGMPVAFNGEAKKSKNIRIDSDGGTSENFYARYRSINTNVTAGSVVSTLNWNLVYN